jgi:hypothetical protein
LALRAGAESFWKTHFWPLKRVVLKGFTTPCSTSSWYNRAPVFTPFSQKSRGFTPMGHPPPNPDIGSVMASLHPWNFLLRLTGRLSINLVVLAIVLLLSGEDFLVQEENVFVPFSACHWRRRSVLVCWISFRAGVRRCPLNRQ